MVTIELDGEKRPLGEALNGWLQQALQRYRKAGTDPCIRVHINKGEIQVGLATAACAGGIGGGRAPRPDEARIIDAWNDKGLGLPGFNPVHMISFLKRLRTYCD